MIVIKKEIVLVLTAASVVLSSLPALADGVMVSENGYGTVEIMDGNMLIVNLTNKCVIRSDVQISLYSPSGNQNISVPSGQAATGYYAGRKDLVDTRITGAFIHCI
jgi:hypothetical protein